MISGAERLAAMFVSLSSRYLITAGIFTSLDMYEVIMIILESLYTT